MTDENQDILDQMLLDVEEHQGETGVGTVVDKGGGDTPPMIISSISGGGKVKVYDTLTGEMSWVLYNKDTGGMLKGILTQKRENGTRIYTLNKPNFEPVRGTLQCLLHKDNPNRKHYSEMGLPVCRKSNITAPYMVEQHMKNRHPSAWKIIERERDDLAKQEEREFQRGLMERVSPSKQLDELASPYIKDALVQDIMERVKKNSEQESMVVEPQKAEAKAPLYVSNKPSESRKKSRAKA